MNHILLVEDEPASADYLASLIRRELPGMEVAAVVENGEEALHFIRRQPVDIVVTDIKMPVMDGLKLAEAVRAAWPMIPVVIVSGYELFEYAKTALRYGVSDYLLKPVKPRELAECLERVALRLEYSRKARQALGAAANPEGAEAEPQTGVEFRAVPGPGELRARIDLLLTEYERRARDREPDRARADFEALTAYIDRRLSEKLTLEGVCRANGMSQTTLSRLFRTYAHCTFVEYLTGRRVELARALIQREPTRRMKEIAAEAGFSDPLYFSRVFRAGTGVAPTDFAKDCLKGGEDGK